jgi:transcriptional regulator with XRE-family HTH domain
VGGQEAARVLAANLRARREDHGISLSELARRSGIAKGTLSQLESGGGNPTLETVFSLSNALGVPVSALLSEQADPGVVVVRSAEVDVLSGEAIDLRMLRRVEAVDGLLELYDQRVRPGAVQDSAGHPGVEHHIVVSGRMRVTAQGRTHEVGPGDYVSFRADGPHRYEAVGGPVESVLLLQYPGDVHAQHLGAGCVSDEPRG